jgi:hypothetical protein
VVGISHRFLTDWPDGTGLWQLYRTLARTLTCGYGFRCTGRTRCIDLWVRRFPFAVAHVAALRVTLDEQPSGTSGSPVNS